MNAAQLDAAIAADPLSRTCWQCDRKFSVLFCCQYIADSGRTMLLLEGPLVVQSALSRELFDHFTKIGSDGCSKIPNPRVKQFIDGVWYWGDINQEIHCSTECHRRWYREHHN